MDDGWRGGIVLIAVGAWQLRRPVVAVRVDGFWAFALPTAFGALALGLLVYDHFMPVNTTALVLSGAAVAAVIVRMVLTFRRNAHLLETSRRDAETDELTGLANRRLLLHDPENRSRPACRRSSSCLTSTASSRTTTPSATGPATRCCTGWQ